MSGPLNAIDIDLLKHEKRVGQYGADSHYHLARARFLLSIETGLMPPSAYFYASLEYRFCIEKFLFTLLVLVCGEDSVTCAQEKMYTGSNLKRAIQQAEPNLLDKLRFLDLALIAYKRPQETAKPDLDRLSAMHGRLGGYLHAQKRPADTTWSEAWHTKLVEFLSDCDEYLGELHSIEKVLGHSSGLDDGFVHWQEGMISDEEVIARIEKRISDSQ